MFRRKLMIALFALGTVGGFASGIHSMRRHCRRNWDRDRQMQSATWGDCHGAKGDHGPRHHKWQEEE